MLRKTYLAALSAALLIPAARGQDLPAGSLGGQTTPVTRGQAGTQPATSGQAGNTIGSPTRETATGVRTQTGAGAQAGAVGQDDAATSRRSGVSDQLFATAAAAGGVAEVNLSQIGLRNATNQELKDFSQRMVDEHTRVNQELKALAEQKGVTMPTALDARAAFCSQSLAGLTGEEFDRCYAKAQLVAHMDAAAMYEAEAERGMDNDIKAFAAKTLPHIKDHLKTIRPIAMRYEREDDDQSPEHRTGAARDAHRETESSPNRGAARDTSGSGTSGGASGTTGGSTPRNSTGGGAPGAGTSGGTSGGASGGTSGGTAGGNSGGTSPR